VNEKVNKKGRILCLDDDGDTFFPESMIKQFSKSIFAFLVIAQRE